MANITISKLDTEDFELKDAENSIADLSVTETEQLVGGTTTVAVVATVDAANADVNISINGQSVDLQDNGVYTITHSSGYTYSYQRIWELGNWFLPIRWW